MELVSRAGQSRGPRVPAPPRRHVMGTSGPRAGQPRGTSGPRSTASPARHRGLGLPLRAGPPHDIGPPYRGGASRHVAPLRRKSPSQARRRSVVASLPWYERFAYGHADNQAIFPVTGSVRSTCRNTQCMNGLRASVRFGSVVAATRTTTPVLPTPTASHSPSDHPDRPQTSHRRLGVVGRRATRCIARRPARSPYSHLRPQPIPASHLNTLTVRPAAHPSITYHDPTVRPAAHPNNQTVRPASRPTDRPSPVRIGETTPHARAALVQPAPRPGA